MENHNEHIEALKDIRNMMEKSSRFVSLSGFAGVFIGVLALCGALAAYLYIGSNDPHAPGSYYENAVDGSGKLNVSFMQFFVCDAIVVLALSLGLGYWMSLRKAKKAGLNGWDKTAQRVLVNLMIPLFAGGVFSITMVAHGFVGMVIPVMLLFYGMALVNASKFTFEEIRVLGLLEMILGLAAAVWMAYGLIFWTIGFGVLHIVYGAGMYFKYEK